MNKKRLRNTAICLVLTALSYVVVTEFMGELFALAWHVRHGRTAQIDGHRGNKYDVTIPVLSWPLADEGGWDVTVVRKPGRVRAFFGRREWGMMSVSVSPLRSTTSELRESAPLLKNKLGVTTNEVASFSVAGQELHCFERTEERGELAAMTRRLDAAQLECVPLSDKPGFTASFIGSRTLVPAFYTLVRSVRQPIN